MVDWLDLKDFQKCMDVNYMGTVRCCKAFLPILKQQAIDGCHTYSSSKNNAGGAIVNNNNASRILNITSAAGFVPTGEMCSGYAASKHAVTAFSGGLRLELASTFGIQVATVCPSFHVTPLLTENPAAIERVWRNQPESIRRSYGEAFFEAKSTELNTFSHMVAWNMEVLVEQVMHNLLIEHVPSVILVGSDARSLLAVTRMVPAWLFEWALSWKPFPSPRPAVMMMSNASLPETNRKNKES